MTDDNEKKEETSEQQQSHRKRSIEEQANEIGDVKLSPMVVIILGALICVGLITALVVFLPDAMKKDSQQYVSRKKTDDANTKNDPNKNNGKEKPAPKGNYKIVKAPANPKIKIKTNKGDMIVELYEDKAPNTVANFVELCQKKFYDDIRFHRIIKGFMIQVGCPFAKGQITGRAGTGDAGYKVKDEIWAGQKFNEIGLLAMANNGAPYPNTNGSQIFIMHTDDTTKTSQLDHVHTIFGKVIEGMNVVDIIANTPVKRIQGSQAAPPLEDVYIISTEILQLRDHEYVSEKIYR